tara:strand:+ start:7008 stop:8528 length:1521 start_codon:yes stop_codon:yes gene_type:complete
MISNRVLNLIGYLLFFLGLSMLISAAWSFYYNENDLHSILNAALITSLTGFFLILFTIIKLSFSFPFIKIKKRSKFDLSSRDGYILVTLSWILMSLFSSLPFYLYSNYLVHTHAFNHFINCYFESISGLTTTGATILNTYQIDTLPKGLLFWRSFTQFIGGIGIIVFSIAILPLLGFGGVQLFRAEVAGPVADKLTPRVQQTAKLLWVIYIGLIISQTIILMIEGLTFYDSITHSFTTIATAGFSTHSESIAFFSPLVQYTIIFFMIVAATSFSLHFLAISKGKIEYFKDQEFKVYLSLIFIFLLVFFTDNYIKNFSMNTDFETGFRNSLFTSVTLLTTTGFTTVDYETWGYASQTMIFILFFIGGCAGSTTGAIKLIRTILVFKFLSRELKKLIHPKGVFHIRIGGKRISEEVVSNTVGFYLFYIFIFVFAAIIFGFFGSDIITSLAVSASALGNIGPGLGDIGPSSNWNSLPNFAKLLATFLMLLGRLEIFTVMLLFSGVFSKK